MFCVTLVWKTGCNSGKNQPISTQSSSAEFSAFVDDYFSALFDFSPTSGTASGFHQYDARLENLTASAIQLRIQRIKTLDARLKNLRTNTLNETDSIDAEILEGQIHTELLDLETIESWKKNPMPYIVLSGGSIDALMKRNFAPPPERLRSLIARLRQIPSVHQALTQNVTNPPREFAELALKMATGSKEFFGRSVAVWAAEATAGDVALRKEFDEANLQVLQSLKNVETWLRNDLLPRSKGKYAIGAETFARKLSYEERVDISVDQLLNIGERNLEKDYNDFVQTARKINPAMTPAQVMKSISDRHPNEFELIDSAKETVESIRQFLIDKKIVTIPSDVRPTITGTPAYQRSGSFASMDSPGPYETKANEAFYYITPVEKDWDPRHKEEHLRLYNRPVMDIITIHEAYPGHFLQFLYAKQFPTKTRKLISCGTNVEGWAHYTEQMMLEQGFGAEDPKVRLAQLQEALLRDCRYVVGIKLHTQGWTVEQGAKLFVERAFEEPANAYEEARRGAYNPTYLYYTLGKLMIYQLRGDYQKAKGSAFTLEGFHNEFAKQGGIPIKFVRQILLPGDKGSLL